MFEEVPESLWLAGEATVEMAQRQAASGQGGLPQSGSGVRQRQEVQPSLDGGEADEVMEEPIRRLLDGQRPALQERGGDPGQFLSVEGMNLLGQGLRCIHGNEAQNSTG